MKHTLLGIILFFSSQLIGQLTPEITSWKINTTNAKGYASIPSNVQQVQYSTTNVYVSATCIPNYNIGPWKANPNIPVNKNFVFKITRTPIQNTGTLETTPLGHIGIWSNGVSIFNAKDGMSYENKNIWNQDALFYEGISFDDCLGHPGPSGEYHLHVNPKCLYDDTDSKKHSPIIGYAFDGFPIYGAYGYANVNGTGGIKRMLSSYVKNTGTTRVNGPSVNNTYPIGAFIEDYTFTAASGDLDKHNGRFCVTPDYPNGIYAYFVTINAASYPVFPYTVGPTYYGKVQAGNTGMNSGKNTITEVVKTYTPTSVGVENISDDLQFEYFPNPASNFITLFVAPGQNNNLEAELLNGMGQTILIQKNIQPAIPYTFNLENINAGFYFLKITDKTKSYLKKIVVVK